MSSAPAAPGSPAGRKMTKPVNTKPARKTKSRLEYQPGPSAKDLSASGAYGDQLPTAGGRRRRRRKSKRKSRKKSHKKKRKTKRRRKSRKKRTKRRRRR